MRLFATSLACLKRWLRALVHIEHEVICESFCIADFQIDSLPRRKAIELRRLMRLEQPSWWQGRRLRKLIVSAGGAVDRSSHVLSPEEVAQSDQ